MNDTTTEVVFCSLYRLTRGGRDTLVGHYPTEAEAQAFADAENTRIGFTGDYARFRISPFKALRGPNGEPRG